MKKASRLMPKYKEKPMTFWGWLFVLVFLAVILGLVGSLIWTVPIILLGVPVLLIFEYRDRKERKMHFEKLLSDRDNDSICTFSRHFEFRKIDTWVIRAVYEQLQNYMASEREDFPIRPTDDIFSDLRIDDEEFDMDIVEEISERTGRTLEGAESNKFYGKANIVENLVYFFNEQPKANET